jgi:hypothetical protein
VTLRKPRSPSRATVLLIHHFYEGTKNLLLVQRALDRRFVGTTQGYARLPEVAIAKSVTFLD